MFDLDRNNIISAQVNRLKRQAEPRQERKKRHKSIAKEKDYFKQGILYLNEERVGKASKAFKKLTKERPDFEEAWLYRAQALIGRVIYPFHNSNITGIEREHSYLRDANNCFDRALELNPNNIEVWLGKAMVSYFIGTYEETLKYCNEAMKLEPNKFWLQIAQVHERFKHFKEGIECIEKALSLDPLNEAAQRYKVGLENGLRYGTDYFLPLATAGALLWSVPPNEEIKYTTSMTVIFYSGPTKNPWRRRRNILFTDEGIYCNFPILRSPFMFKPTFIPFSEIRFPKLAQMAFGPKGPRQPIIFRLSRVSFFESIVDYNSRSRDFKKKIKEYALKSSEVENEQESA